MISENFDKTHVGRNVVERECMPGLIQDAMHSPILAL